ncbi:hypothetical protein HUT16_17140 [Kitasatospora sp. NA04385]|uniref:hypothetical protein n=1 Tax=Kitasatospora sp. NA04385 TaxID=2742135 RepID=UPI0015901239|nr:hypothetical protein [Kitasatospora sp. NA04385]QKW20563.1 hypothetical protein HUT16_17140 [Kitasatospora sp. NA04385]
MTAPANGARAVRVGPRYIEAPAPFLPDGSPSIYLFGKTAGCPDWQIHVVRLLRELRWTGTVLNPRPSLTPTGSPYDAWRPFGWQDRNVPKCDVVLFWNPISADRVLSVYTAGLLAEPGTAVVFGSDPADPEQQALRGELERRLPWLPVADTLAATVHAALAELEAAPARS